MRINYPISGATIPEERTWRPFDDLSDRFWAVGCNPARKAHRIVGEWPGNDAVRTACGSSICLHGDWCGENWPFPLGGLSFDSVEDIPTSYVLCVKCVLADATVE